MSNCIDIADSIVHELNNAELGITAVRACVPKYDLRKDDELKVQVVPVAIDYTIATRADTHGDYQINIGFLKKLENIESEVEDMYDLIESVAKHLRTTGLSQMPTVKFINASTPAVYDPDLLEQKKVFLSVLTVTYKGIV